MYTADVLSRYVNHTANNISVTSSNDNNITKVVDNYVNMIIAAITVSMPKSMLNELVSETSTDVELTDVLKYVECGWPKHRSNCAELSRRFWEFKDELSVVNGLLLRGQRIVVPRTLRGKYLDRIHYGHLGQTKCLQRARETVFWPGYTTDITNVVLSCDTCQKYRPAQTREPLHPHDDPMLPYDKVGIDLFTFHGIDYIIIADYFSSYPEVFKLGRNTKSASVIQALKACFARWGKPLKIISDNGPQLVSAEFDSFCKQWEIEHEPCSPHLPRSNGKAEKMIGTVKLLLKKSADSREDFY